MPRVLKGNSVKHQGSTRAQLENFQRTDKNKLHNAKAIDERTDQRIK